MGYILVALVGSPFWIIGKVCQLVADFVDQLHHLFSIAVVLYWGIIQILNAIPLIGLGIVKGPTDEDSFNYSKIFHPRSILLHLAKTIGIAIVLAAAPLLAVFVFLPMLSLTAAILVTLATALVAFMAYSLVKAIKRAYWPDNLRSSLAPDLSGRSPHASAHEPQANVAAHLSEHHQRPAPSSDAKPLSPANEVSASSDGSKSSASNAALAASGLSRSGTGARENKASPAAGGGMCRNDNLRFWPVICTGKGKVFRPEDAKGNQRFVKFKTLDGSMARATVYLCNTDMTDSELENIGMSTIEIGNQSGEVINGISYRYCVQGVEVYLAVDSRWAWDNRPAQPRVQLDVSAAALSSSGDFPPPMPSAAAPTSELAAGNDLSPTSRAEKPCYVS